MIDITDPEQPKILQHIWRKLHCINHCRYTEPFTYRTEWIEDVGYCLDRYSLIDSKDELDD